MKKDSIKKKLGILAIVSVITSMTIIPCFANAVETVEQGEKVVISEEVSSNKKRKSKRTFSKGLVSGDAITKKERKAKYENLTDEEKEALKAERKAKKEERKAKYESLKDEEKEALKAERKTKKEERKAKFENLTDEEKEALKAERKTKREERKAKYESLTDEEKEALKAERKTKKEEKKAKIETKKEEV